MVSVTITATAHRIIAVILRSYVRSVKSSRRSLPTSAKRVESSEESWKVLDLRMRVARLWRVSRISTSASFCLRTSLPPCTSLRTTLKARLPERPPASPGTSSMRMSLWFSPTPKLRIPRWYLKCIPACALPSRVAKNTSAAARPPPERITITSTMSARSSVRMSVVAKVNTPGRTTACRPRLSTASSCAAISSLNSLAPPYSSVSCMEPSRASGLGSNLIEPDASLMVDERLTAKLTEGMKVAMLETFWVTFRNASIAMGRKTSFAELTSLESPSVPLR
mmetsp:Transcript_60579/g.192305  ORF Transcript_60579/g.192305 Transcript_60579/m.192305 type:complete len:280 (-) Transcript_60579:75-914(-)